MLIETRELTLSNVDLGTLDEFSAMVLFGDAYLHGLAVGTQVAPTEIQDAAGNRLYPGFFWTHLQVPPHARLEQNNLWDRVSVGVDLAGFGGMILDSTYVLAPEGQLSDNREDWDLDNRPSMRGASIFVVDDSRSLEPTPAVPREGMVAALPKLQQPPSAIVAYGTVQRQGSIDPEFQGTIHHHQPLEYLLTSLRDLRPGHAVMFATLARVMDAMERQVLEQHAFPQFPSALLDHLSLLERETYYLANCHDPGMLQGRVRTTLQACSPTLHGDADDIASSGIITSVMELYEKTTGRFLATSRAKKLLALPAWQKTNLRDAERMLSIHGVPQDSQS